MCNAQLLNENSRKTNMRNVFNQMDEDGTGKITAEQFIAKYSLVDNTLSEDMIMKIFMEAGKWRNIKTCMHGFKCSLLNLHCSICTFVHPRSWQWVLLPCWNIHDLKTSININFIVHISYDAGFISFPHPKQTLDILIMKSSFWLQIVSALIAPMFVFLIVLNLSY